MKLRYTKRFLDAYNKLDKQTQSRVDKALRLLVKDLRYPSLNAKIVDSNRRIWRARITRSLRFTFQIEEDVYVLRNVGKHNDTLINP